ncbi:uncharacterized protein DUF1439 [Orbus hercynius]|uniref:Uncharacterized protein DUF1439 n=1 Tax=Orbus hercynius TaxID=593135 RepID=A0A495RC61_9GAMM|nr:DUF1439 domain-containing protein [Orbus hercynius]RKS84784.1 uncharacterized protein DUF1439 [Orbus hercynius]
MLSKKILWICPLLVLMTLISGCQKMTQYSLSQQVINSALQKQLSQYNQSIDASDLLKIDLAFNDMSVDIGQTEPNKIVANGNAMASVQTPLGKQNVAIKLRLKALPELNKQQEAIYLKQVEIADYQINSALGSLSSGTLLPYLNQALQLYFEHNPIYQLDKRNTMEYLIFSSASKVNIEQGKLVFSW